MTKQVVSVDDGENFQAASLWDSEDASDYTLGDNIVPTNLTLARERS